jgi:hypothetical protein
MTGIAMQDGGAGDLRAMSDRAVAMAERMMSEPWSCNPARMRQLLSEIRALQAMLPGTAATGEDDEAFDNMPV